MNDYLCDKNTQSVTALALMSAMYSTFERALVLYVALNMFFLSVSSIAAIFSTRLQTFLLKAPSQASKSQLAFALLAIMFAFSALGTVAKYVQMPVTPGGPQP